MPVYSYTCKNCGAKFDLLVGVTSEKVELKCKKCGSKKIKKELGSFNIGSFEGKSNSSGGICPTGTCNL